MQIALELKADVRFEAEAYREYAEESILTPKVENARKVRVLDGY